MRVEIYTDGGCRYHTKNKKGAWAAIIDDKIGSTTIISGAAFHTDMMTMELTAISESLKECHRLYGPCEIDLHTDNAGIVVNLGKSLKKWKNFKNPELWTSINIHGGLHRRVVAQHLSREMPMMVKVDNICGNILASREKR